MGVNAPSPGFRLAGAIWSAPQAAGTSLRTDQLRKKRSHIIDAGLTLSPGDQMENGKHHTALGASVLSVAILMCGALMPFRANGFGDPAQTTNSASLCDGADNSLSKVGGIRQELAEMRSALKLQGEMQQVLNANAQRDVDRSMQQQASTLSALVNGFQSLLLYLTLAIAVVTAFFSALSFFALRRTARDYVEKMVDKSIETRLNTKVQSFIDVWEEKFATKYREYEQLLVAARDKKL
jgi:hypothetical protein